MKSKIIVMVFCVFGLLAFSQGSVSALSVGTALSFEEQEVLGSGICFRSSECEKDGTTCLDATPMCVSMGGCPSNTEICTSTKKGWSCGAWYWTLNPLDLPCVDSSDRVCKGQQTVGFCVPDGVGQACQFLGAVTTDDCSSSVSRCSW